MIDAEAGDFVAAVEKQKEAIRLATRQGDVPAPTGFERRLSLYESRRVFRESILTGRVTENCSGEIRCSRTGTLCAAEIGAQALGSDTSGNPRLHPGLHRTLRSLGQTRKNQRMANKTAAD